MTGRIESGETSDFVECSLSFLLLSPQTQEIFSVCFNLFPVEPEQHNADELF